MASPLILLGLGIAIGFLPMVGSVAVEPQIVPEVILPPLLFGAAVAMPVMDVRRELLVVAGLVLVSAMVLGSVIHAMVPEASPAWALSSATAAGLMTDSHCPGVEQPGPGPHRRPDRRRHRGRAGR